MRQVTLAGTDIQTSALGFGCAGVFREPSRRGRRRLLADAYDAGIRHFDVAPMYGLGRAERELGQFARGRRSDVVLVSKFGIAMSPAGALIGTVQGPARRLMQARPGLRTRARESAADPSSGGAGEFLYRRPNHTPADVARSLRRTLRALATDHLDLLLLHDPSPEEVRSEVLSAYLEDARSQGLIRAWGLTGEPAPAAAALRAAPRPVPVVQYHHDVLSRGPDSEQLRSRPARITFGVLGQAVARIADHVAADARRRDRWSQATGVDCASREQVAQLLLRQAAIDNAGGVVLFSSIGRDHLSAAVQVFDRPLESSDPELIRFLELVDGEIITRQEAPHDR